jgi:DNA-binding IclR family transcriptional regulator
MKTLNNMTKALKLVAASPKPISVSEICTALDLPRSSASRLMASLRDSGLIEQVPRSRQYVAGPLAWELGVQYRPLNFNLDAIAESLAHISLLTGLSTWLAVLDKREIILLRHHQGSTPILISVRLGQRLPAHTTAMGKALLSRLSDRTIKELYDETLPSLTGRSLQTRTELITELDEIRQTRLAYSRQEAFPGIVSVAGAIMGVANDYPIGISMSYQAQQKNAADLDPILEKELRTIGQQFGDDYWAS